MIDQMLTLADDQDITAVSATGFVLSEHTINLGNNFDPAIAEGLQGIFTVKASTPTGNFNSATPATDTLYVQLKASTSAGAIVFGSKLIQELQLTVGTSARYTKADLTKGKQIPIMLNPQAIAHALSTIKPQGYLRLYGLVVMEDVSFAPVNFTEGKFDLEIRTYNPRGQKYYPKAVTIG